MIAAASFIVATVIVSIQFGWTPLPEGGNEYVVQVEPELIGTFEKQGFTSDIPPELRDVRRIRIQVGSGPVPNGGVTVLKPPLDAASGQQAPAPGLFGRSGYFSSGNSAGQSATGQTSNGQSTVAAADQKPLLRNVLGPSDDETAPQKSGAANRSSVNLTADETRSSRFDKSSRFDSDDSTRSPSHATNRPTTQGPNETEETSKPWFPLIAAVIGLFASLGGNIYLGWLYYGTRRQYQTVVDQLRAAEHGDAYPVELHT